MDIGPALASQPPPRRRKASRVACHRSTTSLMTGKRASAGHWIVTAAATAIGVLPDCVTSVNSARPGQIAPGLPERCDLAGAAAFPARTVPAAPRVALPEAPVGPPPGPRPAASNGDVTWISESGKRALVCAASRGSVAACAEALAGEGVELVLERARGGDARGDRRGDPRRPRRDRHHGGGRHHHRGGARRGPGRRPARLDILITNAGGPPPANGPTGTARFHRRDRRQHDAGRSR